MHFKNLQSIMKFSRIIHLGRSYLITTVTAENGSAGQPANQKGNEIKISFSDTMYVYYKVF